MRQSNLGGPEVGWLVASFAIGLAGTSCRETESRSSSASVFSAPVPASSAAPDPAASARPATRKREPSGVPGPGVALGGPVRALLEACADGFVPSATARVDAVRLGLLCGPSGGLASFGRTSGTVEEAVEPARYEWSAERGDCFRLFAVADEPVDDLEVEVLGPGGERVLLVNQNRRWAVAPADDVFCSAKGGDYEARFGTHGGRGGFAAAVWRGRRMLGRARSAGKDSR